MFFKKKTSVDTTSKKVEDVKVDNNNEIPSVGEADNLAKEFRKALHGGMITHEWIIDCKRKYGIIWNIDSRFTKTIAFGDRIRMHVNFWEIETLIPRTLVEIREIKSKIPTLYSIRIESASDWLSLVCIVQEVAMCDVKKKETGKKPYTPPTDLDTDNYSTPIIDNLPDDLINNY